MAKITITKTPNTAGSGMSADIINAANQTVTVTDSRGRAIGIKRLNALDRMRLFETIGGANANNEAYLGYATLAYHAVSIDGEHVSRPSSKLQLEGLVSRLDDDGIQAIALAVAEHFAPAGMAEAMRERVGNG